MWNQPENDQYSLELYFAGQQVGPGKYKQLDRDNYIHLECEGVLPVTLDGQVACYTRVQLTGE